jgi:site-specific DNA-methyltransferase (adenine-specific)
MPPHLDDGDVRLYVGDCVEVMREMDAESVDAVVCDPPYGLEFMGKDWDSFRVDDPGTTRNRGERAGNNGGAGGGDGSHPASSKRASVAYGGGNRPRTSRCVGCGKRDQFRNAHSCPEGTRWAQELVDPFSAPPTMLAFAEWVRQWSLEAYRVLKPGGHLLAFGGTRTFHRLTCGIEDAGFEIRDCLSWLYGSGFPKSLDVSKAIDKAAGAEREVVGERKLTGTARIVGGIRGAVNGTGAERYEGAEMRDTLALTAPATDAAREWEGWGTALKPAWEPCVVARKPLVGTVAANVQAHGTGALNVDGCRIPHGDDVNMDAVQRQQNADGSIEGAFGASSLIGREIATYKPGGRWPANVAFDEDAAAMLDAQTGVMKDGVAVNRNRPEEGSTYAASSYMIGDRRSVDVGYGGSGGASRFFYTAKASRADRTGGGVADNTHPTVKPTDLMRWLVRLVTPPGGVVLDPFAGSGSTLVAARAEGVRAVGIEREPEYADIITARLAQLSLFSEGMGE